MNDQERQLRMARVAFRSEVREVRRVKVGRTVMIKNGKSMIRRRRFNLQIIPINSLENR